MSKRRSRRWKVVEKRAADALGGRRVDLPWTCFQERPDFYVDDFRMVGDSKAYARFSFHRHLEAIQSKYCQHGETPILVTQEPRKPAVASLPLDALAGLLNLIRGAECQKTS